MKSKKISQNPSFDNFLKNKKWKVIDTANERSVAGLSFAVSTSIWAHAVQKLFPYVTPVGKTTKSSGSGTTVFLNTTLGCRRHPDERCRFGLYESALPFG